MQRLVLIVIVALFAATPADASPQLGTKAEAVAMVHRVEAMFKKEGAAATFKAVDDKSNTEFHKGVLYPFIYDFSGRCVAHGAFPALIGKNLIDLKDPDGKYLVRAFIATAKNPGHGWVDYKWPNPITRKIEDKSSYVERMGKYWVGVGVYGQ
jgi:signal transduction histidine kinase